MEESRKIEELQELQRKLGKKQHFEESVSSIATILRDFYPSASPSLRKSIYQAVCRVGTVLQTRYTASGFWFVGLKLFEEAERIVTGRSEMENIKNYIARAHEQLDERETESPPTTNRQPDTRYLFEGHLTVGPEPPPPTWLVTQNLLTRLAAQTENMTTGEPSRIPELEGGGDDLVRSFLDQILDEAHGSADIASAIEASLQNIQAEPKRPPPASKEVVANLPIIDLTEDIIAKLGTESECAVCRENLLPGDKMQELPCKHLFHPPCLKPWLDEHNSCPICRYELRTDNHAYESWKEREKELEEERRGAENAVRGGEFMYV